MKDYIDSMLFTDKANSMKPRWEIVLYAYNLFTLNWLNPKTAPIIKDKKLLSSKVNVQEKLKNMSYCSNASLLDEK